MEIRIKKSITIGIILTIITSFFFVNFYYKRKVAPEREPWMTIFVHGCFGSTLGLLNAYQVMNDKVEGTYYKKVVSRMRKDPFFYREQLLLQRGLVWVAPTFDLSKRKNNKFAAYPLCKFYQKITDYVKPKQEKNYFYTFGWSGLLSQSRRCSEAIRFYNEVSEKLEKYHKKGIYPKVRVLTHSHGGNVLAYVAAIDELLRHPDDESLKACSFQDRKEVLTKMCEKLKSLPSKAQRRVLNKQEKRKKKSQKRWDYKPEKPGLLIDELILWGMPVQPETDHLFFSPVFKKCYHFYSGDDLVQRVDWISTKKGYSNRRFDRSRAQGLDGKKNKFVQSRIMVGHDVKKRDGTEQSDTNKKKESFWSVLFSGGALVNPVSQDPTHKELWFFSWNNKKSGDRKFILSPFPVACFSPLFIHLLEKTPNLKDADINIMKKNRYIKFCSLKHKDNILQSRLHLRKKFLRLMRKKVQPWSYDYVEPKNLFDFFRQHVVAV